MELTIRISTLIDNFLLSSVIVQEERFQQDEKVRRETRRIQALSMGKASQSGL